MNGEMWQFVAVITFLVVLLLAAYWSGFVPRRTPDELLWGERRQNPGGGLRGVGRSRTSASSEKPEKADA